MIALKWNVTYRGKLTQFDYEEVDVNYYILVNDVDEHLDVDMQNNLGSYEINLAKDDSGDRVENGNGADKVRLHDPTFQLHVHVTLKHMKAKVKIVDAITIGYISHETDAITDFFDD